MMGTDQSLFDIENVVYCGEGNSTIVVTNTSLGWILRIRKCSGDIMSEQHAESRKRSSISLISTTLHVSRYFGARFTRQMHLVQVAPEFLSKLEQKISSYRPTYRRDRGVDHSEPFVITAPDAAITPHNLSRYTFGPTISVEIKPKFGAILLWPSTGTVNVVKTSASLFCLRQNHSGKLTRWRHPSFYCPCDLFSGNHGRMIRGLRALFRTPQINLRIHLDSWLIFSHEYDYLAEGLGHFFRGLKHTCRGQRRNRWPPKNGISDVGRQCNSLECPFSDDSDRLIRGLLLDALLRDLDSVHEPVVPMSFHYGDRVAFSLDCQLHKSSSSVFTDSPDDEDATSLPPEGSILGRVFATQLLSRIDICFVVPHYERVCQFLKSHPLSWDEYVRMSAKRRAIFLSDSPELVESFDIVERYLISLVARDCSVMISLQRAKPDCPSWVPTVGGTCLCLPRMVMNAVVVDLDAKALSKISGRVAIEQAIVNQMLQRHPQFLASG